MGHQEDIVAGRVETANERMLLTQFEPLRTREVAMDEQDRAPIRSERRRVAMERALPSIGRAVVQPVGSGKGAVRESFAGMACGPGRGLDDAPGSRHQCSGGLALFGARLVDREAGV